SGLERLQTRTDFGHAAPRLAVALGFGQPQRTLVFVALALGLLDLDLELADARRARRGLRAHLRRLLAQLGHLTRRRLARAHVRFDVFLQAPRPLGLASHLLFRVLQLALEHLDALFGFLCRDAQLALRFFCRLCHTARFAELAARRHHLA